MKGEGEGGEKGMSEKKAGGRVLIAALMCAVAVAFLFLYLYLDPADPEYGRWFPKCLLHTLTGLSCPSCGAQRAFHAVLGGNFIEALRCNWFLLFSGAYLLGLGVSRLLWKSHPSLWHFFWGRTGGYIYVATYVLWFVVRNIAGI